ncbi:MAG: hypothetical protein RJB05_715, partial [Armatimonadota bacterium]
MHEKLLEVSRRYDELASMMMDPAVAMDPNKF